MSKYLDDLDDTQLARGIPLLFQLGSELATQIEAYKFGMLPEGLADRLRCLRAGLVAVDATEIGLIGGVCRLLRAYVDLREEWDIQRLTGPQAQALTDLVQALQDHVENTAIVMASEQVARNSAVKIH